MREAIRFTKQFARDLIFYSRYLIPSVLVKKTKDNDEIDLLVDQLKRNGYVELYCKEYQIVANYLEKNYFNKIENNENKVDPKDHFSLNHRFSIKDNNNEHYMKGGMEISAFISFLDEGISSVILDERIHSIIYRYYKRQHYFRNQPRIMKTRYEGNNTLNNCNMHVDHPRQISIILNVSDITMDDTHTVYAPTSNRRNMWSQGMEMPVEKSISIAKSYEERKHFIGKKGTLFIFDTSGFHQANYKMGNPRKIMHLNINTGHYLQELHDDKNDLEIWKLKNDKDNYIKSAFNKIK